MSRRRSNFYLDEDTDDSYDEDDRHTEEEKTYEVNPYVEDYSEQKTSEDSDLYVPPYTYPREIYLKATAAYYVSSKKINFPREFQPTEHVLVARNIYPGYSRYKVVFDRFSQFSNEDYTRRKDEIFDYL
jgi:hypothetical protein